MTWLSNMTMTLSITTHDTIVTYQLHSILPYKVQESNMTMTLCIIALDVIRNTIVTPCFSDMAIK